MLIPDRALSDWFEEAARLSGQAQAVGNWIANDLLRELGRARLPLAESKLTPAHLAALVRMIEGGEVRANAAREIFNAMFWPPARRRKPSRDRLGLKAAPSDAGELEGWCRDAIAANSKALAEFKAGKESAINAFKGPVMKAAKGKADPASWWTRPSAACWPCRAGQFPDNHLTRP